MADLEQQLKSWTEATVIDATTAERIRKFEQGRQRRLRWPAILAIGFGALMLCAGILLFVAAHWDDMSPGQRFILVVAMVGVFHLSAAALGVKVPSMGVALHVAGTATLGAGIFLAGQIFNLQEHWPGGVMLWAVGAVLGWLVLRQWPQAVLAAVLIPFWLGGEWDVATERYADAWNISAQGFLLLAILYLSTTRKESNRQLRTGLIWTGALALLPFLGSVMYSGEESTMSYGYWYRGHLPETLRVLGYAAAYIPVLALAVIARKKQGVWMLGSAFWVAALAALSRMHSASDRPWIYLWVAAGACGLCFWGVQENRRLFINYGIAIFALNVIAFYFSNVLDKMGRSMGLILLGVIFLAGGWVLNRVRSDLIARARAAGGAQ